MFNPTVRDSFFNEFNNIFNSTSKPREQCRIFTGHVNPRANIFKDELGYQISLAAPGLSREDFDIEISENILTISSENNVKNENSLRQEYSFNKFSRSWSLPETAVVDGVTADYKAGILNVNIPIEDVTINKTKKIEVR